jgi:chromate reductase
MISLIVGTNRPGSNSRRLAAQVEAVYAGLQVPLRLIDLAQLPAEIFLPTCYAEKPASFQSWADAIVQAAGLIVVTPEYNGSMPGVLKYFIDMLKFPESLCLRPVCFIGLAQGQWGGLRAVEQLQAVFGYRNAFVYPEKVLVPRVQELWDAAGQFASTDILARLKSQAVGFVQFVENLQGVRLRPARS